MLLLLFLSLLDINQLLLFQFFVLNCSTGFPMEEQRLSYSSHAFSA